LAEVVPAFKTYQSPLQAFEGLAKGEVDFLPEGRVTAQAILGGAEFEHGVDTFAYLRADSGSGLSAQEGLHLMMPDNEASRRFLEEFNRELATVKKSLTFQQVQSELNKQDNGATEVVLEPIPGETRIRLHPRRNSTLTKYTPRGTRALVLEWPQHHTRFQRGTPSAAKVRIKLLSGPSMGRIVYVDERTLTLK
jgi:hypothetical protein